MTCNEEANYYKVQYSNTNQEKYYECLNSLTDTYIYMEVLAALNVVYKSRKSRNPNELLSFILDNLHSELNKKTGNYNINNNNNNNNLNDKNSVIQNGIYNFANSYGSLISKLFNWFEIKELQCQQCSRSIYNFYTFNTFELDILGTYKFKNKYSQGSSITLRESIQY